VIRCLGVCALLAFPSTAAAGGFTLSADLGKVVTGEVTPYDIGMRAGYTIDIANLHLTPEISERLLVEEEDLQLGTFLGARVAFGHVVAPGIYFSGGTWTYSQLTSMSGGLTLDLRAIPLLVTGIHGGYTTLNKSGFISAGFHVGFEM